MTAHPNDPHPSAAAGTATVAKASRMPQYVNENLVYLYTDGAWRGFSTTSTAVMQRIQDAFANTSRFEVYVWYSGATASNVQITSV
jgi:hypothetical protein